MPSRTRSRICAPIALLAGLGCTYDPSALPPNVERLPDPSSIDADRGPVLGSPDARGFDPPRGGIDDPLPPVAQTDGPAPDRAGTSGPSDGPNLPDAPASAPDASDGGPADTAPPRIACGPMQPCASPRNCLVGFCEEPPATCGGIKALLPSVPDGLYWLAAGGMPQRVYCDMASGEVLCGPTVADRRGRTREGSNQPFTFRSQLLPGNMLCRIWAVRHATDRYPFKNLAPTAGLTHDTCQAFGFKRDGMFAQTCGYGRERTDCGFGIGVPFYLWGNDCDCVRRPDGSPQPRYVKEGVGIMAGSLEIGISVSNIPWNATGTVSATCYVQ